MSSLGAIGGALGAGLGGLMGQVGNIASMPRRALWSALGGPEHGNELVSNLTGLDKQSALAQALGFGAEVLGDPLMYTGMLGGRALGGAYAGELGKDAELLSQATKLGGATSEMAGLDAQLLAMERAANAAKAGELGALPQLPSMIGGKVRGYANWDPSDVQPLIDAGIARTNTIAGGSINPSTVKSLEVLGVPQAGLGSNEKLAVAGNRVFDPEKYFNAGKGDPFDITGLPGFHSPPARNPLTGKMAGKGPLQAMHPFPPDVPNYAAMQHTITPEDLAILEAATARNLGSTSNWTELVNPTKGYGQPQLMEDYLSALNSTRKLNPTIGQMQSGAPTGLPRGYPQTAAIPPGAGMQGTQDLMRDFPALANMDPATAESLIASLEHQARMQHGARMLTPTDMQNIGIAGAGAAGIGAGLGMNDRFFGGKR